MDGMPYDRKFGVYCGSIVFPDGGNLWDILLSTEIFLGLVSNTQSMLAIHGSTGKGFRTQHAFF